MTATPMGVDARPAYRDLNVLRWLAGLGLSLLGDHIYFIALGWAAAQVASPSQVGLILAAGSIPRALLLPFGGAIADRFGPKRLVVVSDAVRTLVMLAFAVALIGGRPSALLLAGLAVVFGMVDALFLPAVGALPPRLVDAGQLARLQGMRGLIQRASLVVGAPLAGWVTAMYGLTAAFGLNAVLFAGSVLALILTRLRPLAPGADQETDPACHHAGGLLGDVRVGLRYIRGHRLLAALLVLSGASEFGFSGPLNTGLPLLATEQGWGPQGIGLTLGAFGVGAAGTALVIVVVGRVPRAGIASCLAVATMGVAVAAIGVAPTLFWAVAASFALGLGGGIAGSVLTALILHITDGGQLGRVMAFASLASYGGIPISYTLTGFVADLFAAGTAFLVGGGIAVAVGVVALLNPGVRGADLPRP